MKHITILFFLFLIFQTCIGQTEKAEDYKLLFKTADSLNKLGNKFSLDSSLLIKIHQLDKQSPASYFEESLNLFDENQFDDAAVLFYIGIIRHKYYISTNPNYAPNDDWVMAESMKAAYSKKFNFVIIY
jgi:hypothetical protein